MAFLYLILRNIDFSINLGYASVLNYKYYIPYCKICQSFFHEFDAAEAAAHEIIIAVCVAIITFVNTLLIVIFNASF